MSTKNDFLDSWVRRTGDAVKEARHRVRLLSEAGLLPQRSEPISHADIARALLAFVGSETHKDAPGVVRRLAEFRCGAWEPAHPGDLSPDDGQLAGMSLLEAISTALRPPFEIVTLRVTLVTDVVELHVHRWHPQCFVDGWEMPDSETYHFGYPGEKPARTTDPLKVSRTADMNLIRGIVADLMPEVPSAAESLRKMEKSREQ